MNVRVWSFFLFALAACIPLAAVEPISPSALRNPDGAAHRPGHTANQAAPEAALPPRVAEERRFLIERGIASGAKPGRPHAKNVPLASRQSAGTSTWQPVGPAAVSTPSFGLVTGRVTALALDPSDTTGSRLYVGTTGGGVWFSQNAGSGAASSIEFVPLTDDLAALSGAADSSISIGALTVQPGGTGVILAGTGDPNDALDSYYGAGILRSTDGGNTWSLVPEANAAVSGNNETYSFAGEGFAGFAWSTVNPELVVAAVSQAFEATVVSAELPLASYEGLYYSTDSGATWNLATISDGGSVIQGPGVQFAEPDGNAATAVVWNPVRQIFIAAVRFHGYYQSVDGITWTRMAAQPGAGFSAQLCPTNIGSTGSVSCPIYRGALAVNPQTGDTFAWTVDVNNQDQGLWQDKCSIHNGSCASQIAFSQQLDTTSLETNTALGASTIQNGDYNFTLAAIPLEQDTILLAGDNDLWRCSLAAGCAWRNTTNFSTCASAKVGGYQHALEWNVSDPLEIFVGNDSGLWRSADAIGETGAACVSTDSSHFQNLNGGLGSLSEVANLAQSSSSQYTMMAGLGINGVAGVKGSDKVTDWPQILGGLGGPVAIDYGDSSNWYANNEPGVSIYLCSQATACNPTAFGASPVVNDDDVDGDGLAMTAPAPFLVDPLDRTQLLIATCRVWRGPANGIGWSTSNAVSPILDGNAGNLACSGDPLIRALAAAPAGAQSEAIYAGMYGALDGGATLAGHIFGAKVRPGINAAPSWQDLTLNPVTNDTEAMNLHNLDISGIYVDPHDATGDTVYVTVAGFAADGDAVRAVYQSTDGGAHWANLTSNLIAAPASAIVVDPQDANTVYVATDVGVFSTRQISSCAIGGSNCWAAFGAGLPEAPVVQLFAAPVTATAHTLTAGTYGRGIWQNPLWTAGEQLTTATAKPASLAFSNQALGTASSAQSVLLNNTGTVALAATVSLSGEFSESDNCTNASIAPGASCSIQVKFAPTQTGTLSGMLTISANVTGGQLTVSLSGTGVSAGSISVLPPAVDFGQVEVGTTSAPLPVSVNNDGGSSIGISSVNATGPFTISANTCGGSLAAQTECQISIELTPAQTGAVNGTLAIRDGAGTQNVQLSGTGAAAPTDTLSTTSLTLPSTVVGQLSAPVNVVLTNSGDFPLTSISASVSGNFQLTGNCGTSLPGHSSCAIGVVFAPAQTGVQTGTLTVTDALRVQTVSLTGTGLAPPEFSLTPSKLSFAPQEVGTAGGPMTITVSNIGGAPMANVSFQSVGASAASFAVSSTTCGARLNNGSSCTAQVKFTPVATGGNAATLVISSSTIGVAAGIVQLSGTGLAPPQINVEPPVLLFNSVVVGSSSAAQTVTISNSGGVALTDMKLSISGDYSLSPGNCTALLAVDANCTASVSFTPSATGARAGVLTVSSVSGAAQPATVTLTGTGSAASTIVTSTAALDFGNVLAGQTSAAKTLTVSDIGTVALKGLTLTVTGAFGLQQNQCGASLPANRSCSTEVVFDPIAAGPQTGTLTIASTTQWIAPAVVTLTGIGLPAPVLEAAPQKLTFGGVLEGDTSGPLTVTIGDPGGAPVAGLALNASGDFTVANSTCGPSLASGADCTTQVVFSPTGGGIRTGQLTVSGTSAGLAPAVVQLSGTGEAPGDLSGSPSNLSFGNIIVGQSGTAQTVTIANTGQVMANGLSLKTSTEYSIPSTTCGASLASGAHCTTQIVFSPTGTGERDGTLTVSSTTSGVGPAVVVLSGTGVPPGYVSVSPLSLVFPATAVGSNSSPLNVTLSDPGTAAAGGLALQVTGDFSAKLCATTLAPGASCEIAVRFSPTGEGVRSGQLTVTTTAPGAAPAIVALTGTGAEPGILQLDPTEVNFPATARGQTSASKTIVVNNPGSTAVNALQISAAGDFNLTANGCTGPLAAGAMCDVGVDFAPTETGGRSGTLTVSSAASLVKPVTASLTGIGLSPAAIGVSPLEISFPVVLAGDRSAPKSVTVTNTGGAPMDALSLSPSVQFEMTANNCTATLAPGASCTAEIVFAPVQEGPILGALTVSSPSAPGVATVALSGTGGGPAAIVLKPAVLNFPTTGVGLISTAIQLMVMNPGTAASLSGLQLKAGTGFRLVGNTCSATLAATKSCTVGVEFLPAAPGVAQATLAVSADGVTGKSATLMGTGFDFTVTPSGGASVTVASGQTASYGISIKALGGGAGLFTFACGALPANAQCGFNPPQETVTAAASGSVEVQIETGLGSSSAKADRWNARRAFPIALGLALLPFALRRRRRALVLIALLPVLAAGVTSCVAASGGAPGTQQPPLGPGSTPPATYSIPVTVEANGVTHAITFSLTVD